MGTAASKKDSVVENDHVIDESLFAWEKDDDVPQRLDFDLWYPLTEQHTMNSALIECTKEEIEAITITCDENRPASLLSSSGPSKVTETHKKTLQSLAQKIDKFIDENGYSEGIFVRFSKRSPKDSILRMNKDEFRKDVERNAMNIFKLQKEVESFDAKKIDIDGQIINAIIRGMTICSCSRLCVKNGNDAIKLITFSERIFQDFKIGALVLEDKFRPKMILREFNHNIDFEYEFRTFVFKDKITAITQYNSMIYLTKIVENKQDIMDRIEIFWRENIHQKMKQHGISSYVMDIGLLKDGNNAEQQYDEKKDEEVEFKFILIEMNPFCTKAGALLFDWKKDVKIMTSEPTTFRILENVYTQKPEKLTPELDELFKDLYKKMKG